MTYFPYLTEKTTVHLLNSSFSVLSNLDKLVSVLPVVDTVSSPFVWRSSTIDWQETEHTIAVNGTNSNTSLSHQQEPPT